MTERIATVAFEGELETHLWEQLRDGIVDAATEGVTCVVVDLSAVTYFDSSAIRALLGARSQLEPRGVAIELGACSPIVHDVVRVTQIDQAFPWHILDVQAE